VAEQGYGAERLRGSCLQKVVVIHQGQIVEIHSMAGEAPSRLSFAKVAVLSPCE
jgi:short-subunit dehydrogenase